MIVSPGSQYFTSFDTTYNRKTKSTMVLYIQNQYYTYCWLSKSIWIRETSTAFYSSLSQRALNCWHNHKIQKTMSEHHPSASLQCNARQQNVMFSMNRNQLKSLFRIIPCPLIYLWRAKIRYDEADTYEKQRVEFCRSEFFDGHHIFTIHLFVVHNIETKSVKQNTVGIILNMTQHCTTQNGKTKHNTPKMTSEDVIVEVENIFSDYCIIGDFCNSHNLQFLACKMSCAIIPTVIIP